MIDWTQTMQQTFEFYNVNPSTWENDSKRDDVLSCSITRDSTTNLLESATMAFTGDIEEGYIRVYLSCIQNDTIEKIPLGTFLIQSSSSKYNGMRTDSSIDGYSPLIELQDTKPPYGYCLMIGSNVMNSVVNLIEENARAPVVGVQSDVTLPNNFVSDVENDTWLSFVEDLISYEDYNLNINAIGQILFEPKQKLESLQPVWTYSDNNSSILYPDITIEKDLYSVPNVVEVLYTSDTGYRYARVANDDDNSPVSIPNRGREVVYRSVNPSGLISPSQEEIEEYAQKLLESASVVEGTLSYKHGYCPVMVGDCVLLNYERAGLINIKAQVVSQSIDCTSGCPVSETAKFTIKLLEGVL